MIGTPLMAGGDLLGGIALVRHGAEPHSSAADEAFLRNLADRAALAFDNARLRHQARDEARHKKEALALLETLFAHAPIGLGFFDKELRFQRLNEMLTTSNGMAPDTQRERPIDEVLPRMAPTLTPLLRRVLASGNPLHDQEIRGETPAPPGEERHWRASYYPLHGTEGSPTWIGAIVREVATEPRADAALAARARQGAALADFGRRALRAGHREALLDDAVRVIATTLDVDYTKVLELLPAGDALLLRVGIGWRAGAVGQMTIPNGTDSQAGYTLLRDEPVLVEDLATEKRFSGMPFLHEHGIVSGIDGRHRRGRATIRHSGGLHGAHPAFHRRGGTIPPNPWRIFSGMPSSAHTRKPVYRH